MSPDPDTGIADTLPPDEAAGPTSSSSFPAHWARYELLDLLGKGGMATVYRARDRRLDRIVAIKFILGVNPDLTIRLLREARAQARIDHPNVCRVYEVGEVEGRAYIALQLLHGEPLYTAAAHMTLHAKLAVVRDVALAIHEAHRLGIVHRDLKPANIMVERTETGRCIPVVMDFGLARETTLEPHLTESGVPVGTPAYMSPEQARGDLRAIDRRSDIYSLGATLYELLTGRRPFSSTSLAATLAMVIGDDPPAPRSLVPDLPVDLETIVLRCLAKDPRQRYPSARQLADDLGRYLDGEPILGRRPSRWQRLRRRARRQRALVILGACSLAVIIAVAALGVRAWLGSRAERARAYERTRLAERLGRDAKDIELTLRSTYQAPLHDTHPDRALVRARMRAIAVTRHELGELGDAVVHDALGRGHLALHEFEEAARELGRAATAGLQTPELHAALGRAYGELYHHAFNDARRSGDKAWLAQRQQELVRQYLAPALAELEASRASGEHTALLEAMIALYRGEFATAEQRARAVAAAEPWSFEARKLAADAAYGAAVGPFDRGDYDVALPGLERAAALYAEASEVARSDASIYEAAAQNWLQRAELDARQGRPARESLEHAIEVIERALTADPEDATAHTTKAYILLRWFRTPSLSALGDRRELLDRIAQAAARAVELDPRDASAWDGLGNAHVYRGIYEMSHGGQGAPWWTRSLEEFGKALAIRPGDPWANNDLAVAHRWLGDALAKSGRDPMPEYQAALRGYERAASVDPHYLYACSNQANLHVSIAEYDRTREIDPRFAVEDARRVGEHCLTLDPNFYQVLDTLAQGQLALTHHLVETGGDPTAVLESARSYLDRAETIHPAHFVTWAYRLSAAGAEATFLLRDGRDPARALATGRRALAETLRLGPACAECYVEAVRFELADAAAAARTGTGSAAVLSRARVHAEKAIALNEQLADARLAAAEVCLRIATEQRSRESVDLGIAYVDRALALNPQLVKAQTVRAALARLRAP